MNNPRKFGENARNQDKESAHTKKIRCNTHNLGFTPKSGDVATCQERRTKNLQKQPIEVKIKWNGRESII